MKRIGIDTNLLLLLVVGEASRDFIEKHKRSRAYSAQDFDLLRNLLLRADQIVVTPTTLAEVSNLAGYGVAEPMRTLIYESFKSMIGRTDERYQSSTQIAETKEFVRLGLTDCAWLEAVDAETYLLTDDIDLYLAASQRGLQAMNFNHMRAERGLI